MCQNCEENLRHWTKENRNCLAFGIPMTWREPMDHTTDCYFCLVNVKGVVMKTKHRIKYPNIPSAIRPIPHSDELPVPVFEGFVQPSSDEEGDDVHVHHIKKIRWTLHTNRRGHQFLKSSAKLNLMILCVIWVYPKLQRNY